MSGNNLIINALSYLASIINFLILARVIISWIPVSREGSFSKIAQVIYQLTEPILAPIRNIMSKSVIGKNMIVDFSPIVAILLIELIMILIRGILA